MSVRFHYLTLIARQFVALAVSLSLCSLVFAQVDRAIAEKLLQQSGTLAQIDALPAQFRANFEQALREQRDHPITGDEVRKFAAMGDASFASTKLRDSIIKNVAGRLSIANAKTVAEWYESENAKKMLALEAAASTANHADSVKRGIDLNASQAQERTQQLKAMVEASRAAEFVANLSINMAVSAAVSAASATSSAAPPTFTQLREAALRDRDSLVKSITDVMHAVYASTYEKATDRELTAYFAYLQSPAGAQFAGAIVEAFDRAMAAASAELSSALVQLRQPPKRGR
jgi:hypothetical protein